MPPRRLRHTRARYLAEYAGMRLGMALAESLPDEARARLCRFLGRAWFRWGGRRGRHTVENLRMAFGAERDEASRHVLARESFEHMGLLAAETVVLRSARWRGRIVGELTRIVDPGGVLDALARPGRPAIWVSGHLGNWELGAMFLATRLAAQGVPLVGIAKPPENPWIRRDLERIRAGEGRFTVLPRWGASRAALAAARDGAHICLLCDDDGPANGIFTPFFGRLASSLPAAATYALRLGAPVVPCFLVREGLTMRFRYVFEEPIWPRMDARPREERERITVEIQHRIEAAVRRDPAQYRWIYNRWKTRPREGSRIAAVADRGDQRDRGGAAGGGGVEGRRGSAGGGGAGGAGGPSAMRESTRRSGA